MPRKTLLIFTLGFMLLTPPLFSQQTAISEIKANPQTYQGVIVTIEATATNLVGEERFFGGEYLVKDDQEVLIKIRTDGASPTLGIRYEIRGVVDTDDGEAIIIEDRRLQRETPCRIEEILMNSDDYIKSGENFMFKGIITQKGSKDEPSYYLQDDWGGIIKVKTDTVDGIIVTRAIYEVTGSIGVDEGLEGDEVFISELSRLELEVIQPPPLLERIWNWIVENWLIILIVIVALIFLFILFSVLRHKEVPETMAEFKEPEPADLKEEDKGEIKIPEPEEVLEGTTLKMAMPPAGTLKMLPGRLVVLSGDETIKEIRFYKTKSEEENEITFGRSAGKPYTHIQLKEMTVSAKQAKIIYAGKKFTLINYATTNPTRVDDVELEENGMVELNEGSKIQMGEVQFEFHLR